MSRTQSKEDADSLKQVSCMLSPLHTVLNNMVTNSNSGGAVCGGTKRKLSDIFNKPAKTSRQKALQSLSKLQQSISNWEGKDLPASASEIVYGITLTLLSTSEASIFLRLGLLCKMGVNVYRNVPRRISHVQR